MLGPSKIRSVTVHFVVNHTPYALQSRLSKLSKKENIIYYGLLCIQLNKSESLSCIFHSEECATAANLMASKFTAHFAAKPRRVI